MTPSLRQSVLALCKLTRLLAGIFLLACVACARQESPRPLPSARPSTAILLPDLNGQLVNPFGKVERAVVFLFLRTDCPISNRYAPEIVKLQQAFKDRGISFWLVYPIPDESPSAIRQHQKEFQLQGPVLRDPEHALVRLSHAQVTPEAAVFTDQETLVYRGRIDDRVVAFGQIKPEPTERDLFNVLSALTEGRQVPPHDSPAIGCFISE